MKLIPVLVIGVSLAFTACNMNASYSSNSTTEIVTSGNGLSTDEVFLTIDQKRKNDNVFTYGETVVVNFENIKGFTIDNQVVRPGIKILIVSDNNDTVAYNPDIFSDAEEGFEHDPLTLITQFTVAFPHRNNEKYKTKILIWDKLGDGKFGFEMPFTITENELISFETVQCDYEAIYLWNAADQKVIADNIVEQEKGFTIFFRGLSGFFEENDLFYPEFFISLIDDEDRVVLESEILSSYQSTGLSTDYARDELPIEISFDDGEISNPVKLKASLYDRRSNSKVDFETEIMLQ